MDVQSVLGTYGWWIVALLFIAAEILVPGYFLLWIGIAAALTGIVNAIFPGLTFLVQAVLFAVFAVASCVVYWRYIRPAAETRDDQPLLNRRGERMIGRRVIVAEAFVNGRGKVRVGDGVWLAEGVDAAVGDAVEVTGVHGATLQVRRAP